MCVQKTNHCRYSFPWVTIVNCSVGGGGTILYGCAATGEIAEHFNGSCSRNLRLPTLGIGWQIPVVALLPASVPFYMAVFLACVKPSHPFCVRGVVRCAGRGRSGGRGWSPLPPLHPRPVKHRDWVSAPSPPARSQSATRGLSHPPLWITPRGLARAPPYYAHRGWLRPPYRWLQWRQT